MENGVDRESPKAVWLASLLAANVRPARGWQSAAKRAVPRRFASGQTVGQEPELKQPSNGMEALTAWRFEHSARFG